MKICLLEPFFSGSHKRWAQEYSDISVHDVHILHLPGKHWKWRMHGAAVSLAQQFLELGQTFDFILASDMLDLSVFLSLVRKKVENTFIGLYFHENQLTYPWSPTDPDISNQRDNHYAFINYTSALSADFLFFNSQYHLSSFCNSLPAFLNQFPDEKGLGNIELIKNKSSVLSLGMNLMQFKRSLGSGLEKKTILWNHRWEYDKNPEEFFNILFQLSDEGIPFNLSIVGEKYKVSPPIFETARIKLAKHIIHFGYQSSFENYSEVLSSTDILPVTSNQDFFGGAVVEAIFNGAYPLLPNRLAYPEHIPDNLKSAHLYDSDLIGKLRYLLEKPEPIAINESLVNFVAKYDWTTLGKIYDQTFEKIAFG